MKVRKIWLSHVGFAKSSEKSNLGKILLFILVGSAIGHGADIGKYFTKSPRNIVVPPGDHVTFECETNIPPEQVRWKLNNRFLHPQNDSDVRISGNFLYVKVSKNRDRFLRQVGDYQCIVEFGAEALTSVPAQLTIAHIDDFPNRRNESLSVVEGNTVAIPCDASFSNPSPIIQFYKDGKSIESEVGNILLMDSGTLHLRNVSVLDSGYYWCSSTNHITSETYTANFGMHLTVTSRNQTPRKGPEFLIKPKPYLVVPQDGNATLECVAVGNPPPYVTWRKLRSPLLSNYESNNENLVLYNINYGHEGEYICEAYNGVGIGDKSLTVLSTIVLNSMPNITKEPMSIVVEEGGEALLDCSTEGLPKPRVYWIFNGQSVHDDGNVKISDTGLRISSVEKKHAGLFQCFATNPMGTVSSPAEVKVWAKQITALSMATDSTDLPIRGSDMPQPPTRRHEKTHGNKFYRGKHKRRKHKGQDIIPPSKPHANRVSDNSVMVRWSVPSNTGYPIQFFKIQYKELSGRNNGWVTLDEDIPPHIHSFEVDDLRVGQAYKFRILAVYSNNDNRESPNSEKFVLHRGTSPGRPDFVPVVTTAAPHNTTSIILRWKNMRVDTVGLEGYFIYYRESTSAGDYAKITVLGSETEAHYITHLKPGTAYDIKIQAFNRAGASNFSSINTAKTLGTASTEKPPEDDERRKKETDFVVPDDPPPTNDRLYVLLGCLFAGFWIFLCITCALCYKCKQRRAEEEAKYPCNSRTDAVARTTSNGHVVNGFIPTIASHLEVEKETSFVARHNNNRPISPCELNASTVELSMMSFASNGSDVRSWTELKPVRTEKESSTRNLKNCNGNGSLRRGSYVTCSRDELDREEFDDKDAKIFPKEHYKGSRKHSLNRKRTSMGDG